MTRTIVTGVDGSLTAAAAAERAADLAVALDARLHVVSAFEKLEQETFGHGDDRVEVGTALAAEEAAARAAAVLRTTRPGLRVTVEGAQGKPADVLVRTAEALGASLIVVGNKRVQGLARVLGSIAGHVTAHAPCDVYVAHTHAKG